MHEAQLFLLVGSLLAGSVLLAVAAVRTSIPFMVAFLALGMLLGQDGFNKIAVTDAELARIAGTVGLVAILFEGGLSTSFRRLRTVAVPAVLLSSVGVVVTALLAGITAHWLFDLPWLDSFLMGAVVSSTDAAAVFATLRFTHIKRRLARTLEAESGLNDPMAIALTVGLIAWIQQPAYDVTNLIVLLIEQFTLGLIAGGVMALGAMWVFSRLPSSLGTFAPVASIAAAALSFGVAAFVGGSGFLAVYIVGLAIGSTPSRYRSQLTVFHEGLAFLAQVAMFIMLGIFVMPHQLLAISGASLVLTLILVVIVRPVAVWLSTATSDYTNRERALLGWAGLRGAVPIVLGTLVLSSHLPEGNLVFNVVFFVVLVSALLQGTTLQWAAKRLGVTEPVSDENSEKNMIKPVRIDFTIDTSHAIAGVMLREIGLPHFVQLNSVIRNKRKLKTDKSTVLLPGDKLIVVCPHAMQPELEDVLIRWRRRL